MVIMALALVTSVELKFFPAIVQVLLSASKEFQILDTFQKPVTIRTRSIAGDPSTLGLFASRVSHEL
jgi:hypothetical protein